MYVSVWNWLRNSETIWLSAEEKLFRSLKVSKTMNTTAIKIFLHFLIIYNTFVWKSRHSFFELQTTNSGYAFLCEQSEANWDISRKLGNSKWFFSTIFISSWPRFEACPLRFLTSLKSNVLVRVFLCFFSFFSSWPLTQAQRTKRLDFILFKLISLKNQDLETLLLYKNLSWNYVLFITNFWDLYKWECESIKS